MSSLVALRALLFAGELFTASMLIMVLPWIAASQKAASARHLIWAGAFGVLLLLPVLATIVPSPIRLMLAASSRVPIAQTLGGAFSAPTTPISGGMSLDASTIAPALGALWLLGACAVGLRFAVGMLGLTALRRRSRLYAPAPENLPKVTATRRECELRLSDSENGPVTWGVFRPVILLPNGAVTWPRERLQAVLLHELAHIRRRDSWAQAMSLVACAIYWPNPLVWVGARKLRREAEIAADDAVILSGVKPSTYAGELLGLASEFRRRPAVFSTISLSMASPSALEARVESVLAPTTLRSGVTKMDVLKIAGFGLVAAAAFAIACPSLAQEPSTPPASPAEIMPPASPTPPTEADAPVPPTDAVPTVHAVTAKPSVHILIDEHGVHRLQDADLKRMRIDIARVKRETREAVERAKPEIEKALAEARVSREEAERAVRESRPEIDAAVDEVTRIRPQIDEALARAQPEIDKALAQVRAELAKAHFDADIKVRVDEALKHAEVRIEAAKARVEQAGRDEQDQQQLDGDSE